MNPIEKLTELEACLDAIYWAKSKTWNEIIDQCHRGDWLLWLAQKVKLDLRTLTLAKARCAKTVIHLMKDERSINAVNVAESFGLGNATKEDLDAATAAAYTAAYTAATAAADAANTATNTAAAYAYAADAYAYVYAYAADTARKSNQLLTANICRETFGDKLKNILNNNHNESN